MTNYLVKMQFDFCNDGYSCDVLLTDDLKKARFEVAQKIWNEYHIKTNWWDSEPLEDKYVWDEYWFEKKYFDAFIEAIEKWEELSVDTDNEVEMEIWRMCWSLKTKNYADRIRWEIQVRPMKDTWL